MSETFGEMGLRAELAELIEAAGYPRPSAIQRASMPVARRGGSVVIRAASGSGALTGVLLAALDRLAGLEPQPGVRVLVITPTMARAASVAAAAARCGERVGIRAAAASAGWNAAAASVLVGSPSALLRAVQQSLLKLDAVEMIAIDGAKPILALGGGRDLEALLQIVPRAAQRVVITPETTPEIDSFVEAHVRRALNVPARAAEPGASHQPAGHPEGDLGYIVVPAGERIDALARLLAARAEQRRAVVTRNAADRAQVGEALLRRGFAIGDEASAVSVAVASARPEDADVVIGFGAPLDAAALGAVFLSGDLFVVRSAELAHLRQVASAAQLELRPAEPTQRGGDALEAFRERVRQALADEDIDAQLLVLEPLFDERSPAEVAGALSALLRRRAPQPTAAAERPAGADGRTETAAAAAFVRLFMSIGQRDNIRPADIVGAIAGEAGVPGGQVGRIEIRDTFTVVEVPAGAAERVIRALNGTTMRGRSVRVDFDRKGGGPRRTRAG
jgi:ATP-dependent RNA helicase DeaD